jgi:transcriptional regulator with XRE-family HTH domain
MSRSREPHRFGPTTKAVATNVRTLRLARGWAAERLAEECADFAAAQEPPLPHTLPRVAVAKIEIGDRGVSLEEVVILAGALGVGYTDLLPDLNSMPGLQEQRAAVEDLLATREAKRAADQTRALGRLAGLGQEIAAMQAQLTGLQAEFAQMQAVLLPPAEG